MGAIIGGATDEQQAALFRFGQHLGIAFQLADDTLDYAASGDRLGKSLGQDFRQGRATLPLLHLLHHCSELDRKMIKDRMETRVLTEPDLLRILSLMQEFGSLTYAMERAQTFVDEAKHDLALFEESPPKRALLVVADYMVSRDH